MSSDVTPPPGPGGLVCPDCGETVPVRTGPDLRPPTAAELAGRVGEVALDGHRELRCAAQ